MKEPSRSTNLGEDDALVRFRGPLIALAIAIIGFGLYYGYRVMSDKYSVKPEKLFTDTFEDNFTSVSNFKGGGEVSGSHDTWLYFKMTKEATLRNKDQFTGEDREEVARRWFIKLFPESEGLKPVNYQYLKLKSRIDNQADHINHYWYLYNWRTDEHYYRDWGY